VVGREGDEPLRNIGIVALVVLVIAAFASVGCESEAQRREKATTDVIKFFTALEMEQYVYEKIFQTAYPENNAQYVEQGNKLLDMLYSTTGGAGDLRQDVQHHGGRKTGKTSSPATRHSRNPRYSTYTSSSPAPTARSAAPRPAWLSPTCFPRERRPWRNAHRYAARSARKG
jgi:hypothetical protein